MLLLLLTCFFCLRVSIQQKYKLYLKFSVLLVQLMLPNIYIKFPLSTSSIASNVGSFQDI